tara:strand:+ start:763 stop:876 length:114 start_codon:yes stop_codon:yes gene_type:complete
MDAPIKSGQDGFCIGQSWIAASAKGPPRNDGFEVVPD